MLGEKQFLVLTIAASDENGNAGPEERIGPKRRSSTLPGAIVFASGYVMKVNGLLKVKLNCLGGRSSRGKMNKARLRVCIRVVT